MRRHDFAKIRTHTVRGKLYRLLWRKPKGDTGDPSMEFVGECESPRDPGRRCLTIWPKQDGLDMVGTIAHETVHGAFWDLKEDAVVEWERDFLRLLRRMGARVTFPH